MPVVQDRPTSTATDSPWVIDITDRPAQAISARAPRESAWRPGPLTAFLAERSDEQRGMLLASTFAVFAFLYGPLGVLAVVSGHVGRLLVVSLVVAAIAAALLVPRPTTALLERGRTLLDRRGAASTATSTSTG